MTAASSVEQLTTTTTTMSRVHSPSIGEELSSEMFLSSETEFVSSHAYEVSESLQTRLLHQYQQELRTLRHESQLGSISMVFFEGIQGLRRLATLHGGEANARQSSLRNLWLFRSAVSAYREHERLDLAKQLFYECASGELRDIASDLTLEMMNVFLKEHDLRTAMALFAFVPPTSASCELAILGCFALRARTLPRDVERVMALVEQHQVRLNPAILQHLATLIAPRESIAHEAVVRRIVEHVLAHHRRPFACLSESTAFAKTLAGAGYYQTALGYLEHVGAPEVGLAPSTPTELITHFAALSEGLAPPPPPREGRQRLLITDVGVALYRERYWAHLFAMLERIYDRHAATGERRTLVVPRALLLEFLQNAPPKRETVICSLRFMCAHGIENPALWSHMLELFTMLDVARASLLVRSNHLAAAALSSTVARRIAMHHTTEREIPELTSVLEVARKQGISFKPLAHLLAANLLSNTTTLSSSSIIEACHSVHELHRQHFYLPLGIVRRLTEKQVYSSAAHHAVQQLKLLHQRIVEERRAEPPRDTPPPPPPPKVLFRGYKPSRFDDNE